MISNKQSTKTTLFGSLKQEVAEECKSTVSFCNQIFKEILLSLMISDSLLFLHIGALASAQIRFEDVFMSLLNFSEGAVALLSKYQWGSVFHSCTARSVHGNSF